MRHHVRTALLAGLLALAAGAPPAFAIQVETAVSSKARIPTHAFTLDALDVQASARAWTPGEVHVMSSWLLSFQERFGGTWEVRWDDRGNRPNVVQGSGVPLIPGSGNALAAKHFGVESAAAMTLDTVARQVRTFFDSAPELLQTENLDLHLDESRSIGAGEGNSFWSIEFQQFHRGVPVDGAFIYARISHGNLVQFGAERVGAVQIDTQPAQSREKAFEQAWDELGFPGDSTIKEFVEHGELRIYPILPAGDAVGERYTGALGNGYSHQLAWRYAFRLNDDDSDATWQVLVDAKNHRVIDARNLTVNVAAKVSGGIYPTTNIEPEVVVDFPFAAVTNSGAKVTDALGIYDYSGGTATVTLDGKYFRMSDACGAISLSNSTNGNLALGTSGGTDCTTPGVGGAGNTHASRTGFYHLTKINQKARGILPNVNWLGTKVTANMNVNQTCNASWNGSTLNFFKSGVSSTNPNVLCGNTGELAAVFLHEWGHGMDTNTGGAANEYGSGEAVGDTFAFLETRKSCIGDGFFRHQGGVCYNCTTCTGVRDVAEFSQSATPASRVAKPANVTADNGINCDRQGLACPFSTPQGVAYRGPMGYEGHCESYIASAANWDLKNALVATFGEAGWGKMDKIWYASLTPSKSAYRVVSGGQCNVAAQVDGCGATNWYTTYLPADDDDGNLANGTPNACRIWDAMNAHGIACGNRPVCTDAGVPDFTLATANSPQSVCAPNNATFTVNVGAIGAFTNAVNLSAIGQPAGTTVGFSPNPVTPGNSTTLTVSGTGAATPGTSTLTISGTATASQGHSTTASLTINSGTAPGAPNLVAPTNGASDVAPNAALNWSAIPGAQSYTVEIASNVDFSTIVATQSNLSGTSWTPAGLLGGTTYYWRVRASAGSCGGTGANSSVFSFTTAAAPLSYCRTPNIAVPDNNATGVTDTLAVTPSGALTGLKLSVDLTHTYMSDVTMVLSKGSTSVTFLQRPGNAANTGDSGCSGNDMDVIVDDAATLTLEGNCINTNTSPAYTAGASYKPNNPLSAFNGTELSGNWTLKVLDAAANDVGTLTTWCLLPSVPSGPADVIFANGFQP